ncbi:methyl-accepting chemotaxis protein [Sphingomonas sp.]|jgi:methyl-accepting chemotaxis protein|uniref:methyl-accepting chemotaxis protein n=1 Tax=Sphingomonas sp. TaxID=28214 RepID=UPI002EDAB0A5
MKIRTFIASSGGVLLAVMLVASGLVAMLTDRIRIGGPLQVQQQQTSDYVADILPPPAYIIEPYLEATLLMAGSGNVAVRAARLGELHRTYDDRQRYWRGATMDEGLRGRLTVADVPARQFWTELEQQFIPAIRAGRTAAAASSYRRLTSAYATHRAAIDLAVKDAATFQAALLERSGREVSRALLLAIASGIIVISGFIGFFWAINRRAVAPLGNVADAMQRLATGDFTASILASERPDEIGELARGMSILRDGAIAKQAADATKVRSDTEQRMVVSTVANHLSELSAGDLTTQITTDFPGEYGALKTNFNEALARLRELIGSVSESAATIRTGSGEIAQASEDLARRTESNAASLEETAASVTQMDGRMKASATAASRTVERADQAIATVVGGRAVADEAVQAMGRVSDSAKGIDTVIEGLDKIAFQTRVLAMNAAVEAGRAGEAGRGFAVVADLVSALAMRAEEEAKRARDQLTVTQSEVVIAVQAVQKVDGALAAISGDVGQVHELLATMAADNMAQSAAITQISAALGLMDRATQQNAAMVEETSAAARNLSSEVGALAEQAACFNVADGSTHAPRSRPRRQPPAARPQKAAAQPLSQREDACQNVA